MHKFSNGGRAPARASTTDSKTIDCGSEAEVVRDADVTAMMSIRTTIYSGCPAIDFQLPVARGLLDLRAHPGSADVKRCPPDRSPIRAPHGETKLVRCTNRAVFVCRLIYVRSLQGTAHGRRQ